MIDGLTDEEWQILKTPISELVEHKVLKEALAIRDKQLENIAEQNRQFVSNLNYGALVKINDSLDQPIMSHSDGKYYSSKSQYEREIRAQGMIVVGNEAPRENKYVPPIDIDWKKAVAETLNS